MAKQPDFYLDPARREEYAKYMSELPSNDIGPNQRKYWKEEIVKEKSKKGHARMTDKAKKAIGAAKPKKYAKGGKIDGCAKKGHTKGRMI